MGLPSPGRPMRPGPTAAVELVDELRLLAREQQTRTMALQTAIERVPRPSLFESARAVVEQVPLVAGADMATIRLADERARLHLIAASGCTASDVRTRALEPLEVDLVKELTKTNLLDQHAASLGIGWVDLIWLGHREDPAGTLLIGARTKRRPQASQLALLKRLMDLLSDRLVMISRTSSALRACALQLARSAEASVPAGLVDPAVARLRERERSVLDLYADGLTTEEVATLLFISPHTVRTHVKSALRTLGVHSRGEAARLVRTSQLLQLP
jgi:DNA-binding NarL/FixJ family response regulator